MQFQFDVVSSQTHPVTPQNADLQTVVTLLVQVLDAQRQTIQLQQEHLAHVKATAQDNMMRWRNLLNRWQSEYPEFGEHLKQVYPVVERSYVHMLANISEDLVDQGNEALDNEFAVQEFLDRYGMRVGQFSHLLSIIGPLAEAAGQLGASPNP